jgi:atypical dual specificity phosphatase
MNVMAMLQRKSAYSSERVEGVYIRFEDERRRRTIGRGKVVRGDFIAGNEHWSKGRITLNGIADHMCS